MKITLVTAGLLGLFCCLRADEPKRTPRERFLTLNPNYEKGVAEFYRREYMTSAAPAMTKAIDHANFKEADAQRAIGIGVRDHVGEADVAEGVGRVGAVRTEAGVAEHEAHAVADRQPQERVDLEVALLRDRAPHRTPLEHAHAIELTVVQEQLKEARGLLDAVAAVAEVDLVQVQGEDLVLVERLLEAPG